MPSRRMRWMLACGTAATLVCAMSPQVGSSGDFFHKPVPVRTEFFRTRAPVRCGLPPTASYGHDTPRMIVAVTTSDAVEEQVMLVLNNPSLVTVFPAADSVPWQNAASPSPDSILGRPSFSVIVPATSSSTKIYANVETVPTNKGDGSVLTNRSSRETIDGVRQPQFALPGQMWSPMPPPVLQPALVRRKSFAPKQPDITAEYVTLDRIGLAIYETGHVAFTGLISHSGGPDGLVRGSDVTLRVRGYGVNRLTSTTTPNGPLHFEMRRTCRVLRGDSAAISLVPVECCETVRARYDEITHLEVILESRHSR